MGSQKPNLESSDFYEVLGVTKDDSDAVIKKAYKKLALQYHPDKNPDDRDNAENKFKKIAEAYDGIGTAEKRRAYAMSKQGFSGFSGGGGDPFQHFSGFAARDLFKEVFGTNDPFSIFDNNPFFGGHPGGSRMSRSRSGFGDAGHFGFGDMGMSMGSFSGGSFASSSSFSSGGGCFSESVEQSTRIVNGRRVTTTRKTIRKPDGTTTTTVTEDNGQNATTRSETVIEDGRSSRRAITRK